MTRNPKPDELPRDLDRITHETLAPPLVLDFYLSRQGVIDRVVDQTDAPIQPSGGLLTHREMAALYQHLNINEQRSVETIIRENDKDDIIGGLADLYGFNADRGQRSLRKSQLVHMLVSISTGSPPDRFMLPSDPDPNATTPDVPVLGEA